MTSECKSMATASQPKQSDFSIEHILTKAGEKYSKRRRLDTFSYSSNSYSSSDSGSDDQQVLSEEDEEIVVDSVQRAETSHSVGYLGNCIPRFDWLYYTRYRPPKLPRPQKPGPVKRTPGRLPRVPFTPTQLSALEEAYKVSTYLSSEEANQLAYSLDLTNTRVKIWFQNRRARDRREKREAHCSPASSSSDHHHHQHHAASTVGNSSASGTRSGSGTSGSNVHLVAPMGRFAYFGSPPSAESNSPTFDEQAGKS